MCILLINTCTVRTANVHATRRRSMTRAREIEEEKLRFRESSMQESVKIAFRAYTLKLRSDRDRDVEKDREKGRERRVSAKSEMNWKEMFGERDRGEEKEIEMEIGEKSQSSAVDISPLNEFDRIYKKRQKGEGKDEDGHYYDHHNGYRERMTDSIGNSADNDSYDNSPHRDVSQKDRGPHSRHKNDSIEIDRNHSLSTNYTATAILEVICCRLNNIVDTIDIFVYII